MDAQKVKCITEHPGFGANCLNYWVLEHAAYEYVEREGPIGDEELAHE